MPDAQINPITGKKQSALGCFFAQRYTPPFRHELPGTMRDMVANESWSKKLSADFKLFRRWFWLRLNLPSRLLWDRLPPPPLRVLWLNYSSTSVGDSIMELAGRAMLDGYQVDLLTNKQHAELYLQDRYFKNVYTDAEQLQAAHYDFVLLDLFNTRSIQLKKRICPDLPCACLQSFFYGASFNRMLFSCYRIHHLLGYPYSEEKLQPFLRPQLFVEDQNPLPPRRKQNRFALMLGGVEPFKTFQRWPEVIRLLRSRWGSDFPELVLVGSQNGTSQVEPVMAALKDGDATSFIGKLTLRQTAGALAACDFFLGTDGGLMHSAVALDKPGLALFGRFSPQLLLPPRTTMHSIYDALDVNNIPPDAVADAILKHPQSKPSNHAGRTNL